MALTASGYFRVTGTGERPSDMTDALDRGEVDAPGADRDTGCSRSKRCAS